LFRRGRGHGRSGRRSQRKHGAGRQGPCRLSAVVVTPAPMPRGMFMQLFGCTFDSPALSCNSTVAL
jgi:hypothetical protein